MNKETICLVGGGSGGDLLPLFTIGNQWRGGSRDRSLVCIMTRKPINNVVLSAADTSAVWRTYQSSLSSFAHRRLSLLWWGIHAAWVWIRSLFFFAHTAPQKVITCGGYLAVPVTFAAYVAGIPVEVWELNSVPGKAVRIMSWWATKVHVVFEETAQYFSQARCVSYPLRFTKRPELSNKSLFLGMYNSRYQVALEPDRQTVLVLGGSQGSRALGSIIKKYIEKANSSQWQVIHQVGDDDITKWQRWYARCDVPAHIISFSTHVQEAYALADVVVSRGGSGTLHELLFFEKKVIVVPLITSYTAHQKHNAQSFAMRYPEQFIVCDEQAVRKKIGLFADAIDCLINGENVHRSGHASGPGRQGQPLEVLSVL